MKVLMIEEGARGGICQYTFSLSNALAKRGLDVTLATYQDYEMDSYVRSFKIEKLFHPYPVALHRKLSSRKGKVFLRGLGHFPSLYRLISYAKQEEPDIIHIQWFSLNWSIDWLPFYAFKKMGFNVVYTAHDILPHDTATVLDQFVLKRVHRLADMILVHGEKNRETCFRLFDTSPGKIHSVPMGNYHITNEKTNVTKEKARNQLGLAQDEKIVLFFGYIEAYKGLSYLIRAFGLLSESVPSARLIIAGRPRGSFDSYSRLISELNLEEQISLNLGYIPMDDIHKFFLASDLVAAPYVETYQSAVVQLAYSFARPVIVTRTGGLTELVEEGKSGCIVEPKDVAGLAGGISSLLNDRHLEDMGNYGKYLADTAFSWDNIAEITEQYYREVCGHQKSIGLESAVNS